MAYGPTGSGKTYSMLGLGWEDCEEEDNDLGEERGEEIDMEYRGRGSRQPDHENSSKENINKLSGMIEDNGQQRFTEMNIIEESLSLGVIPRAISDLFKALEEQTTSKENFNYSISCVFMQIYNEKIYDLLQDKKRKRPLSIKVSKNLFQFLS